MVIAQNEPAYMFSAKSLQWSAALTPPWTSSTPDMGILVIDDHVYILGTFHGSLTVDLWRLDKFGFKPRLIKTPYTQYPLNYKTYKKIVAVPKELFSQHSCG